MLHFLKCLDVAFNNKTELDSNNDAFQYDIFLSAPANLFELIEWLTPAFNSLSTYIQHDHEQKFNCNKTITHSTSTKNNLMINTYFNHNNEIEINSEINNEMNWIIDGLDSDDSDNSYKLINDIDDDKEVEEHSYCNHNEDESDTIYAGLRPFEFGILLSEQFELQMIRCRLVSLLKISEFKLHIHPEGLLKDIINVIVEFELGMNDIYEFTINFLNTEIKKKPTSSYIAYGFGCYESLSMFGVVLIHCFKNIHMLTNINMLFFEIIIFSWTLCLFCHICGAVILWRRGHSITNRLKQLKIAMTVSLLKHHQHKSFDDDIHIGEAFVALERWCNLSEIRLNDKFNSVKILMLTLQKYILPLSIALCILIDPTGSKWYAYISILLYYLHLHILYEIFHNERHAMVAFARVTLFWGIFISIVAAIASATTNKKSSSRSASATSSAAPSSSQEANFLAGLAGLLLFGIFIAVFDVCWFFSDNPGRKRLIFFVILVNFTYIGGCFYMFDQSIIIITIFFTISLIHCQIVFNQIIDCVLYGDVDQYLDLQIPNNFFINSYFQSFCGMTNATFAELIH